MKTVLVPLAEGFEEIEAITIIDIARRGGLEVVVASETGEAVRGSHGITVGVDAKLADVNPDLLDAIALAGGVPGFENLGASPTVTALVRSLHERSATVAAVCAAPSVLNQEKVLAGRRATMYPAMRDRITEGTFVDRPVVVDGHVVTSQGVGTSLAFALELVETLVGKEARDELAERVLFERHPGS